MKYLQQEYENLNCRMRSSQTLLQCIIRHSDGDMAGIPPQLLNLLRQTLLQCEQFESDRPHRILWLGNDYGVKLDANFHSHLVWTSYIPDWFRFNRFCFGGVGISNYRLGYRVFPDLFTELPAILVAPLAGAIAWSSFPLAYLLSTKIA